MLLSTLSAGGRLGAGLLLSSAVGASPLSVEMALGEVVLIFKLDLMFVVHTHALRAN